MRWELWIMEGSTVMNICLLRLSFVASINVGPTAIITSGSIVVIRFSLHKLLLLKSLRVMSS